jgi:hypothetical protein
MSHNRDIATGTRNGGAAHFCGGAIKKMSPINISAQDSVFHCVTNSRSLTSTAYPFGVGMGLHQLAFSSRSGVSFDS